MNTIMKTGIMELQHLYERSVFEGLFVSGLLHGCVIAALILSVPPGSKDIIKVISCGFPPMSNNILMDRNIFNPFIAPKIRITQSSTGIPVPIPDPEINAEPTITTPNETPGGTGVENGIAEGTGTMYSEGTVTDHGEAPPKEFIPELEKYPEIITNNAPVYPDIARRAGMEGTVYIKMWVTKEGNVRMAEVVTSTSELFNAAAINAAVQWKFTPAIMNNNPVSVWVTVPFKFRLHFN